MAKRKAPIERLSGVKNAKDRREALETIGRAFSGPEHLEGHMTRGLWRGPLYSPEHTRVAVTEGRVAAAVVMSPRTIRFGAVEVPAMSVGPVATHDRFRKRRLAAAAMEDASGYMKESGVLVAYLQGIPDFYYRFGYYPYLAPASAEFRRDNAKKEAATGRFRAMKRSDLPRVRRLFDSVTRDRIFAAVRDDDVWEWLMSCGTRTWIFENPKVILDGRGRICGHATLYPKKEELRIGEIVVRQDEAACRAALGALVREARRRELKKIILPVPYDDALAVFLRQYVPAEFKLRSHSTGGALMLVLDFEKLMKAMEPLFAKRCREAHAPPGAASFTLRTEDGAVGITVRGGKVAVGKPVKKPVVKVPRRFLSGMLTGYYAVSDYAARKGVSIPKAMEPALNVLFPKCIPFVYLGDNF